MKSYINKIADYRNAPFERNVTISCSDEYIESQMRHLTRAGKKSVPVNTLEKGDIAVLSLESEIGKFNRPSVFITVGGGLFDKDFEEKLIGHSVNETFVVSVDGKNVKVMVKQATRTVFPAPTDEMAEKYCSTHDGFEGIKTVSEYREKIIDKYFEENRNNAVYDAMDTTLRYVLSNSDFEFDEEEIDNIFAEEKEFIFNELKEEGVTKPVEEFSKEELLERFGVETLLEVDKLIRNNIEQTIAMALWLAHENGADAKNASLEELQNTGYDFLEKFVKENLTIKEER